jgi:hypothetical protein
MGRHNPLDKRWLLSGCENTCVTQRMLPVMQPQPLLARDLALPDYPMPFILTLVGLLINDLVILNSL